MHRPTHVRLDRVKRKNAQQTKKTMEKLSIIHSLLKYHHIVTKILVRRSIGKIFIICSENFLRFIIVVVKKFLLPGILLPARRTGTRVFRGRKILSP